jgi:hypothetical protein
MKKIKVREVDGKSSSRLSSTDEVGTKYFRMARHGISEFTRNYTEIMECHWRNCGEI